MSHLEVGALALPEGVWGRVSEWKTWMVISNEMRCLGYTYVPFRSWGSSAAWRCVGQSFRMEDLNGDFK